MTQVQKEVKSYVQIFFSGESGIQGVKIKGLIKMLLYIKIYHISSTISLVIFSVTHKLWRCPMRNGVWLIAEGLGLKKKMAEFSGFTFCLNNTSLLEGL